MATGAKLATSYSFLLPGLVPALPDEKPAFYTRGLIDPVRQEGGGADRSAQPIHIRRVDFGGARIRTFFDDYYNRIHIIPRTLDFGSVSQDTSASVLIWNAYLHPVTLETIHSTGADGLALTGVNLPETIDALNIAELVVNVTIDGPPTINATFFLTFDNVEASFDVAGIRARLWTFGPNWRNNLSIEYSFKTDIIRSRSGREQRRALRQTARKSMSFNSLVHGPTFQSFIGHMNAWQQRALLMPEYTRFVRTMTAIPVGGNQVLLPSVPPWMQEGHTVTVIMGSAVALFTVETIINDTVTFTGIAQAMWPAGSKICPGISGRLGTKISFDQRSDRTAEVSVSFDASPGLEPVVVPPEPALVFNGREVFLKTPNWGRSPSPTFESDLELVDFGFGRVTYFTPVVFNTRLHEATYVGRNSQEGEDLLNLFLRMHGQRGEFYMPTYTADMEAKSPMPVNTANIRIAGTDFARDYTSDTVNRSLAVVLRDGTILLRRVQQIYATEDTEGHDSVVNVTEPWPRDIAPSDISMISWMPVWRFASDALTFQWMTDEVVQTVITLKTLEDLAGE